MHLSREEKVKHGYERLTMVFLGTLDFAVQPITLGHRTYKSRTQGNFHMQHLFCTVSYSFV